MRKFFTLFAALVCGMAMNAATVYCKMSQEWWTKDGAAVAAHMWGGSSATTWPGIRMTPVSGEANVWSIETGDNTNIIFVRVNGSDDVTDWGAKTKDLTIPTDGKNLFTITTSNAVWGDPGCDGEWSVYTPGDDPVTPPTPQPSDAYWYWKGQVDGGAIENEAGGFNIFNGGMSSISVGDAAYVFVIYQEHGVQGVQYMTDGWLGFEVTHATLNACGDCPNGNKLYLPAGDHTLYLYDNGNGTVELSREELPGKTLVGGGQGIEDNFVKEKAHKTIIDGQLRIVRGDKVFDATGRQIQ